MAESHHSLRNCIHSRPRATKKGVKRIRPTADSPNTGPFHKLFHMENTSNTWPDFAIGLYERLAARNAEIVYELENLEIHVPNKPGSQASHSKWMINGAMKIRTRDHAR
jgi:hypothetical protein